MGTTPDKSPFTLPWAPDLLRRLSGIPEPRARVLKLVDTLRERPPEEIATFLQELTASATVRSDVPSSLHLDLVSHVSLLHSLGYETLSAVYRYASEQHWSDVAQILRTNPELLEEETEVPEAFTARLNALTLGERRQLSRGAGRRRLEMLFFDTHPMVIAELLKNTRLTEQDVVRIASRRRAPGPVLEEVAKAEKWFRSYSVRKALAFNPRTPAGLALSLVPHLRREDLVLMVTGGTSRRELVQAAKDLLQKMD